MFFSIAVKGKIGYNLAVWWGVKPLLFLTVGMSTRVHIPLEVDG